MHGRRWFVAGRDRAIRLADRAGRSTVVAARTGDAGQVKDAAGARARPMGAGQSRRDTSRPRLLEEEGQRRNDAARACAHGPRRGSAGRAISKSAASTSEGWIADFLGQLEGHTSFAELTPPAAFTGTLRPYQTRGYSWLAFLRRWGLGACLADDMGLGKTVQTLALLQREPRSGRAPAGAAHLSYLRRRQLEEGGRTLHAGPAVLVHHGLQRVKGTALRQASEAARPGCLKLCAAAPRPRDAGESGLERHHSRRSAEHQEPRDEAGAGRVRSAGRLPHRPDGHAGRESRRRFVVDLAVSQSRLPRHAGRVSPSFLRADPGQPRSRGGRIGSSA